MLEAGPCPVAPQDLSQSAPECFGLFRRVMNSLVSNPGLLQGCSPRRFVYVGGMSVLCTLLVVLPGSFGVFCPSLETAEVLDRRCI